MTPETREKIEKEALVYNYSFTDSRPSTTEAYKKGAEYGYKLAEYDQMIQEELNSFNQMVNFADVVVERERSRKLLKSLKEITEAYEEKTIAGIIANEAIKEYNGSNED